MRTFDIPKNPEYDPDDIRQLEINDPAHSELFNGSLARIIENIHAVKSEGDETRAKVAALESSVASRAASAESAALIASMASALLGDDFELPAIASTAIATKWYSGSHANLVGVILVPISVAPDDLSENNEGGVPTDGITDVGSMVPSNPRYYDGLIAGWVKNGVVYTGYNSGAVLSDPLSGDGKILVVDRLTAQYYDYTDGVLSTNPVTAIDGEEIITPQYGKFYRVVGADGAESIMVWSGAAYVPFAASSVREVYANLRAELDGIHAQLASIETAIREVL